MSNNKPNLFDDKAKCSCKGFNLDKLLQPRILQILNEGKNHGYGIVQALESTPLFREERADTAGIYRALSTLQERGLVEFEWILETSGPAKKQYMITADGKHCLENWIQTLGEYRAGLDGFLESAKKGK
jgi:DNA-binding PadR family transcriptional regulator